MKDQRRLYSRCLGGLVTSLDARNCCSFVRLQSLEAARRSYKRRISQRRLLALRTLETYSHCVSATKTQMKGVKSVGSLQQLQSFLVLINAALTMFPPPFSCSFRCRHCRRSSPCRNLISWDSCPCPAICCWPSDPGV